MSSPNEVKKSPVTAVKETVLTRCKSAQLSRQLRRREAKNTEPKRKVTKKPRKSAHPKKSIGTQSVKVATKKKKPVEEKKSNESLKTWAKRTCEKVETSAHHLPMSVQKKLNEISQRVRKKKIILKPPEHLKSLMNKRKRVPKKFEPNDGAKPSEVVGAKPLAEEAPKVFFKPDPDFELESLTDSDLNEIILCPSPVWWEDDEDVLFINELKTAIDEDPEMKKHLHTVLSTKDENSDETRMNKLRDLRVKRDLFKYKSESLESVLVKIKTKPKDIKNKVIANLNVVEESKASLVDECAMEVDEYSNGLVEDTIITDLESRDALSENIDFVSEEEPFTNFDDLPLTYGAGVTCTEEILPQYELVEAVTEATSELADENVGPVENYQSEATSSIGDSDVIRDTTETITNDKNISKDTSLIQPNESCVDNVDNELSSTELKELNENFRLSTSQKPPDIETNDVGKSCNRYYVITCVTDDSEDMRGDNLQYADDNESLDEEDFRLFLSDSDDEDDEHEESGYSSNESNELGVIFPNECIDVKHEVEVASEGCDKTNSCEAIMVETIDLIQDQNFISDLEEACYDSLNENPITSEILEIEDEAVPFENNAKPVNDAVDSSLVAKDTSSRENDLVIKSVENIKCVEDLRNHLKKFGSKPYVPHQANESVKITGHSRHIIILNNGKMNKNPITSEILEIENESIAFENNAESVNDPVDSSLVTTDTSTRENELIIKSVENIKCVEDLRNHLKKIDSKHYEPQQVDEAVKITGQSRHTKILNNGKMNKNPITSEILENENEAIPFENNAVSVNDPVNSSLVTTDTSTRENELIIKSVENIKCVEDLRNHLKKFDSKHYEPQKVDEAIKITGQSRHIKILNNGKMNKNPITSEILEIENEAVPFENNAESVNAPVDSSLVTTDTSTRENELIIKSVENIKCVEDLRNHLKKFGSKPYEPQQVDEAVKITGQSRHIIILNNFQTGRKNKKIKIERIDDSKKESIEKNGLYCNPDVVYGKVGGFGKEAIPDAVYVIKNTKFSSDLDGNEIKQKENNEKAPIHQPKTADIAINNTKLTNNVLQECKIDKFKDLDSENMNILKQKNIEKCERRKMDLIAHINEAKNKRTHHTKIISDKRLISRLTKKLERAIKRNEKNHSKTFLFEEKLYNTHVVVNDVENKFKTNFIDMVGLDKYKNITKELDTEHLCQKFKQNNDFPILKNKVTKRRYSINNCENNSVNLTIESRHLVKDIPWRDIVYNDEKLRKIPKVVLEKCDFINYKPHNTRSNINNKILNKYRSKRSYNVNNAAKVLGSNWRASPAVILPKIETDLSWLTKEIINEIIGVSNET